jgi:4'-phosphopantetheinyl transferase EntD
MFQGLLPPAARWVVATPGMATAPLQGAEVGAMAGAVERRMAEFRSGRAAARAALAELGVTPGAIPVGADRAPVWPRGVVGSITHCTGLCVSAVASDRDLASLGIDAEPAEPLPDNVLNIVATRDERSRLADPVAGRVLFCAKEAFYKNWSARGGPFLDFTAVEVVIDGDVFHVRATGRAPFDVADWPGRWAIRDGFILAASWSS